MKPIELSTQCTRPSWLPGLLIALMFTWLALSPHKMHAVSPPPDGGYPGTSQGPDVPKQLTMPTGGPGAATNLTANRYNDPGQPMRALVKLEWSLGSQQGSEQRVVVTIFPDGFQRGAFDVSSRLPSTQTSLVWDKVKGQAIHHWKVLTLLPSGWVASQTGTFEGPLVIRDHVDRSNQK